MEFNETINDPTFSKSPIFKLDCKKHIIYLEFVVVEFGSAP